MLYPVLGCTVQEHLRTGVNSAVAIKMGIDGSFALLAEGIRPVQPGGKMPSGDHSAASTKNSQKYLKRG